MDNKQLNIVLNDLRTIIDCLSVLIEKEEKLIKSVNPKSFTADIYAANLSLEKECKDCLEFIAEALPKLQPNFEVEKVLGYTSRKFHSKLDLQKYRKEMAGIRKCIDHYAWESGLVLNMTNVDTNVALINECSNKLTQANTALYKIK